MITLRDFKTSDAEQLHTLANNKNVSKYLTDMFPFPYTIDDAQWWVSSGCKKEITKVIEFRGEFVGAVGAILGANEKRLSATVGYWLGEPFWGLGLASLALIELTHIIYSQTNIIRISAGVFSPNRASMRVLEKSGYRLEAILENSIVKDGSIYNEHIYTKLKP